MKILRIQLLKTAALSGKRTLLLALLILSSQQASGEEWVSTSFSDRSRLSAALAWMSCHSIQKERASVESKLGSDLQAVNASLVPDHHLQSLPYSAVGRFIFSRDFPRESCSSCTAFLVGTDTVMTAAHCVMGFDGKWRKNPMFIRDGSSTSPKAHGVQCAAVPPAWAEAEMDEALMSNFAVLKLSHPSSHGFLEIEQQVTSERVQIVGYKNNCCGNKLIQLESSLQIAKDFFTTHSNPLGDGGNGAPWIAPNLNEVVSLSSHSQGLGGTAVKGPKLGPNTAKLVEFVASGCRRDVKDPLK